MNIISGTTDFQLNNDYAVTIGKFDGIHRGHRELIDRILLKQKESGMKSAVFTFDVSPLSFFAGATVPGLTTNEEKRRIFEYLGIDTLIEYPLNDETAKISPEQFITDVLCKQINMKYIAVGSDITFGYKGSGNAELLKVMSTNCGSNSSVAKRYCECSGVAGNSYCNCDDDEAVVGVDRSVSRSVDVCDDSSNTGDCNYAFGGGSVPSLHNSTYEVEIVDKLVIDNEEVSSTLIRNVVADGNMEKAANLIGVPYAISGIVTQGKRLGRKIGFPTVNLEVPPDKLMPPNGVYFTEVSACGRHLKGITNIGTKPTVTSSDSVFVETHIFDFDEDIYGQRITVKLLHFERPEQKFPTVPALKSQISADVNQAEHFFDTHKLSY